MQILINEQERVEGKGFSLNVPVFLTSGLMHKLIEFGLEPMATVFHAYSMLQDKYADKAMDYLQVLNLVDDTGKKKLKFFAISNAEVGTDTSEREYGDYNITFLLPSEY